MLGYVGVVLAASFLERNSWVPGVIVAVVLFIVGTGITLYLRRKDTDSKHLDYQILSDTPIVTSRDRPEILKVMFGSTEVRNPFITEVKFKNTGKQVIEADDFLAPIEIKRPHAKVLDFNDVDQSETGLVDHMSRIIDPPAEGKVVTVLPQTLNAGDWFTIQVIYDGGEGEVVTATGRIKGQTRPPQAYQEREGLASSARNRVLFGAQSLLVISIMIVTVTQGNQTHPNLSWTVRSFLLVLMAIAMIMMGIIVWDESNRIMRDLQTLLKARRDSRERRKARRKAESSI